MDIKGSMLHFDTYSAKNVELYQLCCFNSLTRKKAHGLRKKPRSYDYPEGSTRRAHADETNQLATTFHMTDTSNDVNEMQFIRSYNLNSGPAHSN